MILSNFSGVMKDSVERTGTHRNSFAKALSPIVSLIFSNFSKGKHSGQRTRLSEALIGVG